MRYILLLLNICACMCSELPVGLQNYLQNELVRHALNRAAVEFEKPQKFLSKTIVKGIKEPCKADFTQFIEASFKPEANETKWLSQMLEASGNILPSSIKNKKTILSLGFYKRCLKISHPQQKYRGQYCILNVKKSETNGLLGICLPSSCSEQQLDRILSNSNASAILQEGSCNKNNEPEDAGVHKSWYFAYSIIGLVVLATIVEVFLHDNNGSALGYLNLFSLRRNVNDLAREDETGFKIFNGLKYLSVLHVAVMAGLSQYPTRIIDNPQEFAEIVHNPFNIIFSNWLSLETLFFIEACEIATEVMKAYHEEKSFFRIFVRRWLRFLIGVAFILFILGPIASDLTDGPMAFQSKHILHTSCQNETWRKLLFIDNFSTEPGECWPHVAYVSSKLQLSVVTFILLYLILKRSWSTKLFLLPIAASIAVTFRESYTKRVATTSIIRGSLEAFHVLHPRPYTHAAAWFLGLWVVTNIARTSRSKKTVMLSQAKLSLRWSLSTVFVLISVLWVKPFDLMEDGNNGVFTSAIYTAMHAVPWSLALAWLTYASYHGYGGWIQKVLEQPVLQSLGKLTLFSSCLIYPVLLIRHGSMEGPTHLSYILIIEETLMNIALITVFALVIHLSLENPLVRLFERLSGSQTHHLKQS